VPVQAGTLGAAVRGDDAINSLKPSALDDSVIAWGVLDKPVSRVAAQNIAAGGSGHGEWHIDLFDEDWDRTIAVVACLTAQRTGNRVILCVEAVTGDTPAIACGAGDECIAGRIPVEADGTHEDVGACSKLYRDRLVLHCLTCVGVCGQIQVGEG
jgi:hypothetical protein